MLIGTSVGNQITDNIVTNSTRNGIILAGNASSNAISGNEVGWSADTGIALQLDSEPPASSADNMIGSNTVHDSGSANVSVGRSNIFFEQK